MRTLCAFVLLLLLFFPFAVLGQTTNGSITGRVTDPSKATIAEARVAAVNLGTNFRYESATNGAGEYTLTNLPPGTYQIEVEKSGFKKLIWPDVILHVQDAVTIDFEMTVGSVSDTVQVEAGAPLVNTTSGTVSTVVDRTFVENMPLNGRSFQTVIMLTSGVVVTQTAFDDQGQFSVNGQRADANYFTVDGVNAHFGVTSYSPHATATIDRAINNNLLLWSTVPDPSRDQRNAENQQQSPQENCDSGQWWVQPWSLYLGS